ncbi:MAG: TIGR03088 family PEP-CTERM/XrtA system glycosyltransferase [Chromatiales bacterium]|nr:TIGR03088 family PEP-CTERM/XrtA system glycosyltransferase [Chromatiales bacterium]
MAIPLIAHVLHRLDYGGLENGLINLINGLPAERFAHAVICLAGFSEFRDRIRRPDVRVYSLGKRPGKDLPAYGRLWQLFRRLRPAAVHTRNAGVIDCAVVAWAAGVPVRIHGCHGWDVDDLHGDRPRRAVLRRACAPAITRYVAVSRHIGEWLQTADGVPPAAISQIYNGVDVRRFAPGESRAPPLFGGSAGSPLFVIGTVSRLEAVKDPCTLARAFAELVARQPSYRARLRLAIIGDGNLRGDVLAILAAAGCAELAVVTGWRDDIPDLMRQLSLFVLPSINEGISNTILEAMACGLPVVATAVGGNAELVVEGENGCLVPPSSPVRMADALERYVQDAVLTGAQSRAARLRAVEEFSLDVMLRRYSDLYTELLPGAASKAA